MAKSVKLKVEEELGISVFGIVSQENDLKVSWAINKATGLKLSRTENVRHPKSTVSEGFPAYIYDDEKNFIRYLLILNKTKGTCFFTSLKNIDYMLILKGNIDDNKDFVTKMKRISELTTVISIDPDLIKEKDIIPGF